MSAREELPAVVDGMAREEWLVLHYDADAWGSVGPVRATLEEARLREQQLVARAPGTPTAVVRKTITYTIEEQQ